MTVTSLADEYMAKAQKAFVMEAEEQDPFTQRTLCKGRTALA
jgi:hypothetical protein